MTTKDCRHFETCSASLCPLDKQSLEYGIFYPDEEICKLKKFQTLPWVKKQKRIVKVGLPNDRYFTVEMMMAMTQVRSGMEGVDPDQPLAKAKEAERNWARGHKKEQREALRREKKSLKQSYEMRQLGQ